MSAKNYNPIFLSARPAMLFAPILLAALGLSNIAHASPNNGQSATALPDGKTLLLGGKDGAAPTSQAKLLDPKTGKVQSLTEKMGYARAEHSATLLADGRVLILGGFGDGGGVVRSAEAYDSASPYFELLGELRVFPRAGHTATVLTDGKVLIVGGVDHRLVFVDRAELWDPRTGQAVAVGQGISLERRGGTAQLRADGSVLYLGGQGSNGKLLTRALVYHPDTAQFEEINAEEAPALPEDRFTVTATLPPANAVDVNNDVWLTLRFSHPAQMTTVNTDTIVLIGPVGIVATRVIPAEGGLLAFASPNQPLLPGARYTLFVYNVTDEAGRKIEFQAFSFDTASLGLGSTDPVTGGTDSTPGKKGNPGETTGNENPANALADAEDDEVFTPDASHRGGRWRTGKPLPDFVRALLDND